MPALSIMMKPASGMCNLACDYCFYCDESQKREQASYGFMSEETLKNVIRKTLLRAEGSITYAYQGGEPTLRGLAFYEKAIEYQKQYNKHGVRVQNVMQTNGYLLDDAWCRFFKENNFLIGISVDGLKEIHDAYRHTRKQETTFDRIMESTKLLDHYRVDYNILTVVTPEVAQNISQIYDFYKKKGWMFQQYIACLEPFGEAHGQRKYALSAGQYGEFLSGLFDKWYEDWKKGKQPFIRQFENFVGILLGMSPEACDQRGICGLQHVVEADGSVYPCDFYMMDEYRLGNFNEVQLDVINEKRKEIAFIEESMKLSEECKHCEYYKLCRGGCRRNRDFNQETLGYHNYFCEGFQEFFSKKLTLLQEVANHLQTRRI